MLADFLYESDPHRVAEFASGMCRRLRDDPPLARRHPHDPNDHIARADLQASTRPQRVDAQRMAHNLDQTRGLILAEAFMLALGPHIGRLQAHELVERATQDAVPRACDLRSAMGDALTADTAGDPKAPPARASARPRRSAEQTPAASTPDAAPSEHARKTKPPVPISLDEV